MMMMTATVMTEMAQMALVMAMIDVKVGGHFVSSSAAMRQFCTKSFDPFFPLLFKAEL